jgi:hypothetical protein
MNLVQLLKEQCTLCWFFGEAQTPNHRFAFYCPRSITSTGSLYKQTSFQKIQVPPGIVCFLCMIPFAAPCHHPAKGDRPRCEADDIVKPLAWCIWSNNSIRAAVFGHMDMSPNHFSTIQHFKQWLGSQSGDDACPVNILELIYTYYVMRQEDSLPPL